MLSSPFKVKFGLKVLAGTAATGVLSWAATVWTIGNGLTITEACVIDRVAGGDIAIGGASAVATSITLGKASATTCTTTVVDTTEATVGGAGALKVVGGIYVTKALVGGSTATFATNVNTPTWINGTSGVSVGNSSTTLGHSIITAYNEVLTLTRVNTDAALGGRIVFKNTATAGATNYTTFLGYSGSARVRSFCIESVGGAVGDEIMVGTPTGQMAIGPTGAASTPMLHTFNAGTLVGANVIVKANIGGTVNNVAAFTCGKAECSIGLLYDRSDGTKHIYTDGTMYFDYITATNTLTSPFVSMAGYANAGSYASSGAWSLGPAVVAGVNGVLHTIKTGDQGSNNAREHGTIKFFNNATSTAMPSINGMTADADSAGLCFLAYSHDTNAAMDMYFGVRNQDTGTTFSSAATAYSFNVYTTEIAKATRAGVWTFPVSVTTPTIYGSSAADGDLTLVPTSSATRTTSYIFANLGSNNDGFVVGMPAGAMALNDYVSLTFQIRNSAGGSVDAGNGVGAQIRCLQPGTGVNEGQLDFYTRSDATTLVKGLSLSKLGVATFPLSVSTPQISNAGAGIIVGVSVANNANGGAHTINGYLWAGGTSEGDFQKSFLISSNTYETSGTAQKVRVNTGNDTIGGASISLLARTVDTSRCCEFRYNKHTDSPTTGSQLAGSYTQEGLWAFPANVAHIFGTAATAASTSLSIRCGAALSASLDFIHNTTTLGQIGNFAAAGALSDNIDNELCITATGVAIKMGQTAGAAQFTLATTGILTIPASLVVGAIETTVSGNVVNTSTNAGYCGSRTNTAGMTFAASKYVAFATDGTGSSPLLVYITRGSDGAGAIYSLDYLSDTPVKIYDPAAIIVAVPGADAGKFSLTKSAGSKIFTITKSSYAENVGMNVYVMGSTLASISVVT